MSAPRIALPALALVLLAVACGDTVTTTTAALPTTSAVSTSSVPGTTGTPGSTTAAPTTTPPSTTTAAPTTTISDPDPVKRDRIEVTSPMPGDVVASPLQLEGMSMTFEGTVNYRLSAGELVLAQGIAMGGTAGEWAPFAATIEFTNECCIEMLLEVFEISAEDGSEINKVSIPLAYEETS